MENKIKERLIKKGFEEEMAIELSERAIAIFLDKTFRNKVPKYAELLIFDISIMLSKFYSEFSTKDNIKTIKEGDVSITFNDESNLEKELLAFEGRLSKYKVFKMV